MHKVTFHNLGSADCIRINLENGKRILFDYADRLNHEDEADLRCDLPKELRADLGKRTYFDVVAFTHLDDDHYCGATDFFYFEHIQKYQDDVDGKRRIEMRSMWVPAAIITEQIAQDGPIEAKAIQKEARERFKAGSGIRVFSRPERLKDWCEKSGVSFENRKHLITDAGTITPEFTIDSDGAEFFVHSPFAMRQDENTVEDRNGDALVMHVTFVCEEQETGLFLASDLDYEGLADIVTITEKKKRGKKRLNWDIFKISHHCSYKSLSDERGKDKTKPVAEVARLFETYGQDRCILVSTSDTIPQKGDARDKQDGANPPHRQAATYYEEDVSGPKDGEFFVTMQHPSKDAPEPLVIQIDDCRATVCKRSRATVAAAASAASYRPPRAG